ncbi:MAG TPA: HAD family hydrolase [Polyangiaceae bacterium]|nr:HAD family hydrolase [Polyangiaceae bacterium]
MYARARRQLLLFDFDGVIIDSQSLMRFAFAESCARCGVQRAPSVEQFLRYMGMPLPRIAELLGLPEEFVRVYQGLSRDHMDRVGLYPGATQLLSTGTRRFRRLGLITGKDRRRTQLLLERFGLSGAFDAVVCGDDKYPGKPDPAAVVALRERFDASPAGTLMIGDSAIDIRCARSAGVMGLGAAWGFGTHEELEQAGADLIFGSPHTLRAWLGLTEWPNHQSRAWVRMNKQTERTGNQWTSWQSMAD